MTLLVLFAFLAGIVTILSPCILPILPLVLSGSLTGGKRRPFGIVTGFIVSFTFFTLFLSSIVRATGISADIARLVAVIMILIFGTSLLVPQLQILLERLFSKLARLTAGQNKKPSDTSSFIGGMFVGVSLGLVWTPCVGPILATIIALAATARIGAGAIFITLAYSLGTSIPLLAITYGGRRLLQNHPWLVTHSAKIQKLFGVLMIATALAIYFNVDRTFQIYILEKFPQYGTGLTSLEDNAAVKKELDVLKETNGKGKPVINLVLPEQGNAPEFIAGGKWYNLPAALPAQAGSQGLSLQGLRGKVVLVDFWTYTCINCIRTLPYVRSWYAKYKDKGLVIVGVHTPEFEFEKNPDNVARAIKDFSLEYPIMQDNNYATWTAYNNQYWPADYLIDKNGNIRDTHFGEGDYDQTEKKIQELLSELGTNVNDTINNPRYEVQTNTPESYVGYKRITNVSSPEQIKQDIAAIYSIPTSVPNNSFAFGGTWIIGGERATPSEGSTLVFNFDAKDVYLVMSPKNQTRSGRVKIFLDNILATTQADDDVKNGIVTVNADRLYKLIHLSIPGRHILKLEFLDANLELYAFTFG